MNNNLVKKCRTCLKNSTITLSLNNTPKGCSPEVTYSQLLHEYAQIEDSADFEHLMPQNLCILCCRELDNAYAFIRQARYCNNKLIELIAKQLPRLQEKRNASQHNKNELVKSIGEKIENNCITPNAFMNDFRIVSTSEILSSELLEDNDGNEEMETDDNTQIESEDVKLQGDPSFEANITDSSNVTLKPDHFEASAEENCYRDNSQNDNFKVDVVCPICKKAIGGKGNLKNHMRIQHDIEEFLSIQESEQINHAIHKYDVVAKKVNEQQPKNRVIKCRSCNYTARTYSALNFHNRSKHGIEKNKFKCKFCSYVCFKRVNLLMHMKNSHMEMINSLKADSKVKMENQRAKFEHDNTAVANFIAMGAKDENSNASTNAARMSQNTITSLKTTSNAEMNEEALGDEMCVRNILKTPLSQNSITPPFKANLNIGMNKKAVGDEIITGNVLKIKEREHISTKYLPRRCDECGNIYNNFRALKTHKKTVHISEENYSLCPHCGKKFKRKAHLRIHIKNAHFKQKAGETIKQTASKEKEKRFMCSECYYVCATITTLTIHINRHHTFEKPYKCDICHKSFIVKFDLKTHRYLHTGERPYKCPICSKGFRCSSKMIKHKRIHNNERPYKCKDCGKGFTQSYNLSLHRRTHLREKNLNCTICGKVFENRSLLNIHRINEDHHDEVV